MRQRRPVRHLVSAGGVVLRADDGREEFVVCVRESPPVTALPKGTPDPGETREETAVREVSEETGLQVEVRDFIDSIEYWFTPPTGEEVCHKTVYFYLMSATGGDVSGHDGEFDQVRWVAAEEGVRALTYENEAHVVRKGLSMALQENGAGR